MLISMAIIYSYAEEIKNYELRKIKINRIMILYYGRQDYNLRNGMIGVKMLYIINSKNLR